MAWKIEIVPGALAELKKIDRNDQRRILSFLKDRVAVLENPRSIGSPLRGPLRELWRYRVGVYRVVCDIQDDLIKILVLRLGHRRKVYRR